MLHRALLKLARSNPRPTRFAFSQQPKPEQDTNPTQQNQPAQKRLSEERESKEDQEQEQPFEKQNRNTWAWFVYRLFFWGTFSALSYNVYLVYNHKKKTPVEQEPLAFPYIIGAAKEIVHSYNSFLQFVTQPPSKKLLPDTVHPDLHPKTLILNLNGTIIKTDYVFGKGQKIILRPGLQKLLKRLSQKYEIVIFAEQDQPMIHAPMMKVDPRMMHIRGVLGRQSMVWKDGQFIKDLRYLNRDLRKVIAVDSNPKNLKNQPKNALIIPQFKGDQNDKQLQKLIYLLDKLAEVPDVRKFIETLGDNPVDSYYQRILKRQQQLSKKSGFLGGLAPKNSKKDKTRPEEDQI